MTDAVFSAWHEEIQLELAEAQASLESALAELHTAEAAHASASAEHEILREAVGTLRQPPAFAIAVRVRHRDESLHDLAGAVGRTRSTVSGLRERVVDLQEALAQLQLLAPATKGETTTEELTDAAV